jgi:hypothetical protein
MGAYSGVREKGREAVRGVKLLRGGGALLAGPGGGGGGRKPRAVAVIGAFMAAITGSEGRGVIAVD